MGRIRKYIDVAGNKCWTLFDSGTRKSHVIKEVGLPYFELPEVQTVSLGERRHSVSKWCLLDCRIEGLPVQAHARILEEIGMNEADRKIEILLGALRMQEWGIGLNIEEGKIDMSHYPKEFVEF